MVLLTLSADWVMAITDRPSTKRIVSLDASEIAPKCVGTDLATWTRNCIKAALGAGCQLEKVIMNKTMWPSGGDNYQMKKPSCIAAANVSSLSLRTRGVPVAAVAPLRPARPARPT
jgi:hypothetical protein